MCRRFLGVVVALATVAGAGVADRGGTAGSPPLIGANYTNWGTQNCDRTDTGIIAHYDAADARRKVRAQLAAMHATDLRSLRLLIWHSVNADQWGMLSSASGRLDEPWRSNLIRYLSDIRKAGFESLLVAFGPEGPNDPIGQFGNVYDPKLLEQNWTFLQSVRPLVKEYGPVQTRIDLINEGSPRFGQVNGPQMNSYISELYRRYADAYGTDDVSVSSIADDVVGDRAERTQSLVDALRATGRPLPGWFEVHPPYSHDATLGALRAVDATLTANGLSQPLVVGEAAYDDAPVAQAIAEFMHTSSRPVLEVDEWWLEADLRTCPTPPYRADTYVAAITGRAVSPPTPDPLPLPPIPTLRAVVGPGRTISLRTEDGELVSTLDSGKYRIVVRDRSAADDFHLVGPDIDRRSGVAFRGTVVWNVDLGRHVPYGARYSYRSDRRAARLERSFGIS